MYTDQYAISSNIPPLDNSSDGAIEHAQNRQPRSDMSSFGNIHRISNNKPAFQSGHDH
jgi:hypothetical protein